MPLQLRTEDVIFVDILQAVVVNSQGRLTDANVNGILRTIIEEGLSPEFAQRYHALLEIIEACRINEAQGTDLDAAIADWRFADAEEIIERLDAAATTGFGTFFSTRDANGTASAVTASTLTDANKAFSTNEHAGKLIRITEGIGINEERLILSNTATVITLDGTWSTQPVAGSKYAIHDAAAADVDIPQGTTVFAQGVELDDQFRFRTTPLPSTPTSSTATGGTAGANPTLIDTIQAWTTNEHRGRPAVIRSGTGSGQIGLVVSNTNDTLTIQPEYPDLNPRTWASAPDGTSVYDILEARIPQGGIRAPVAILATVEGSDHNIAENSLTSFEAQPANVGAVHNTDALAVAADFVNGRDVESDPDLRGRFREKLQNLTRGTNPAIISGLTDLKDDLGNKQILSVGIDESVYPALVYIDDGTGGAAPAVVTRAQDALDGTGEFADIHPLRSSGYPHTAVAATGIGIAIVITILAVRDGFAYADVKEGIEGRVRTFFNALKIGEDVAYNRYLATAVGTDAGGVLDLGTVTLNGDTVNISIALSQKAFISSLSVA